MYVNKAVLALSGIAGMFLAGCHSSGKIAGNEGTPSLRKIFIDDFAIGTALSTRQIEERDTGAARVVPYQFNAVTPENIMKAEEIHPEWARYNFDIADKLVAYANKNNMQLNGHTLIWHSQLPGFVRQIKSNDSVRQFFTEHINTIASRYDGKIYSWDVVNEALNEDGTMRKSVFLDKLGDDFVTDAFRLAQKASPNAKLYYNDYNIEQPKKRAGAIALIKKVQAAGVRIDGVGIQGHWHLNDVPFAEIEQSRKDFSALGIEVMFTELDINVLPNAGNIQGADVNQRAEYQAKLNPYKDGLPDSLQTALARDYQRLFQLFLKYKKEITRITLWGVNDGQSWLNGWPIPGRTNYPLLFDRKFAPKPAFYSVIDAKKSPAPPSF
ncbi:MAG TPA: endo-1,4-beta-xylanase [Chitinophagaceae bacterium]|nr:endo-1,4-beta-xylanase [Chitinophagaceae bacterium]